MSDKVYFQQLGSTTQMTMSEPAHTLVSILTPSFNQARWLSENIRSVNAQTYPAVEHVVMDGGSRDGSLEILRADTSPNLRWRSEADHGQADALNKALADSQGDIIGWLNSDDAYFGPSSVALAVAAFKRHPDAALVYGHAALVNATGRIMQVMWAPPSAASLLRLHDYIWQPAVFMRRTVLGDRMVDPNLHFMLDWDLWLRLSARGRMVRVNRILAIDRHHAGRKVVARQDLAVADFPVLRDRYRLIGGPVAAVARKSVKIGSRFLGALRVPEAMSSPLAFDGHRDSPLALFRNQLMVPRNRMPFED